MVIFSQKIVFFQNHETSLNIDYGCPEISYEIISQQTLVDQLHYYEQNQTKQISIIDVIQCLKPTEI